MKFEYMVVIRPLAIPFLEIEDWLNCHGDKGWELVSIDSNLAVFKRGLP